MSSHGYPTARSTRHHVRPSKLHGTLCRCGKETKKVWQLVGPKCWSRVPKDLRANVWAEYKKQKGTDAHIAACRAVIEWLIANSEEQS